ncbi:MAG: hypothetical protein COA42_06835 [Alteromonadaceae bacterium]|nr:MAG: hypothetical protein COA42_06835 [Alteromonadaceae bacterium]
MKENTLLNSVVRLTQQRDASFLESILMSTIAEELDVLEVILFKPELGADASALIEQLHLDVNHDLDGEDRFNWVYACGLPEDVSLIDDCFSTLTPIVDSSDSRGTRILTPLVGSRGGVGVVSVLARELKSATQILIHGFCKIYTNYIMLIDDSERDTLTGLLNRKTFDKRIEELLELQVRQRKCASQIGVQPADTDRRHSPDDLEDSPWLVMFDIDRFKNINDTMGHIYGDEVILRVSQLICRRFRRNDLLFRYGGDEFIVLLSSISEVEAYKVVDSFREFVAQELFPQIGCVTVSIGCARMNPDVFPRTIVEQADKAMYYAKNNGRNCCYFYNQLVRDGEISLKIKPGDIDIF